MVDILAVSASESKKRTKRDQNRLFFAQKQERSFFWSLPLSWDRVTKLSYNYSFPVHFIKIILQYGGN